MFDELVKQNFPGAITNSNLVSLVTSTLSHHRGFDPTNTLLATSFCSDELARKLEDDLADVYGHNFNLGGLSGFPFAGRTGFDAMAAHPEYVAGEGRACTELMRAMKGRVAIKTGAEAVFIAMIPEKKLGLALKIEDGNSRASEAALVAILARLGVLDAAHPMAQKRLPAPQINCRGLTTGELRLAEGFL